MLRVAGIDLPRDRRIEIGLTDIHGTGRSRINDILSATRVDPDTKVRDLTQAKVSELRQFIDRARIGRRIAAQSEPEYPAPEGDRMLPRNTPPQEPARARAAHPDVRPYPQGASQDCGRAAQVAPEKVGGHTAQ
jgi:hypothetical protein